MDKTRAYSETIDCPVFVQHMDLPTARRSSKSFDKLCRELEKLIVLPAALPDPKPIQE
jgi:hypothetical protein